ncbi:ATP-dependent DNA helicase RuvA [Anoxybacillus gonensis]|uniref:Holliday junction branch migration complex subunit RuvA n=1 Tax=Anoxybacillus gonensis TaxID=198467 RepID=A0AAW7TJP6_9BACL|nr:MULTISPECIES: Holliday junction branch migration protein RuvA [Anoxybacillus]AXM89651.1 Holliday junction branch migration protein RuvA [Anoxybacillus ayderensis G10]THD16552.1 Holliday junction branch migration protein RuvA [Anoxybacillus ayderensis]AKS39059.1 ATP-dependent DNA helicase RuvA [Anoxybacillus gonensis]EMI10558.1 Holliday junction DNA helicase RuvA [Anoxybacillus gonensis]KGP59882.1 ATP-dependent DNA helicase RuvA [Anoxybacillus gonensis]
MIEFIRGYVDYVCPEYIVVEHNGVGYQIFTPNPFSFQMNKQKQIVVYTYQYVREDVLALYGFHTRQERALFAKLLQVSGIGPKGALAILAAGQLEQLVEAIEAEDDKFLCKFPGVGKKTARQMILDLKGKLQAVVPDAFPNLFTEPMEETNALSEALEALKALGYAEKEIQKVVPILKQERLSTEGYIKLALQKLLK